MKQLDWMQPAVGYGFNDKTGEYEMNANERPRTHRNQRNGMSCWFNMGRNHAIKVQKEQEAKQQNQKSI